MLNYQPSKDNEPNASTPIYQPQKNNQDVLKNVTLKPLQEERDLYKRILKLKEQFKEKYAREPQKIVVSPGRAEIIGCHTDYNNGFSLAAAIENTFIYLSAKRDDNKIRAFSTSFDNNIIEFEIAKDIEPTPNKENGWNNYLRGVVSELLKHDFDVESQDILIDSNVPQSGGVSSSAGLELGMAYTVLKEEDVKDDITFKTKIARICQLAENNYVNCPCGFLDQGAVAFGDTNKMVFLDFLPKGEMPVSEITQVCAALEDYEFIISVDPKVKRQLGLSGYPARRKMCEESLPIWSKLLKKEVKSLRDVTPKDFDEYKDVFEKINPVMRKRIEHVIFENERVIDAKKALEEGNIETFGKLLTESGKSAIELYELAEGTPELSYLFKESLKQEGVIGSRNMGGGFSAVIISLVKKSEVQNFKKNLSQSYKEKYGAPLEFINFKASKGCYIL